ncbi:NAD(P)/FAD-dependent oxidoreductase [Candidatus Omnitrophota bacterium]
MLDVIIIGGAPAGLTAAIYTSREQLNTLVLEQAQCGGMPATTDLLENYPGFPEGINGTELIAKFKAQALKFGTDINEDQQVRKVSVKEAVITVETQKQSFKTKALIAASGSIPKPLNLPGEEKFRGRGVSYCATCDGPLFRDRDIAVIGCGNSGLQEGEHLLKFARSVTFVEFLPEMTAAKILQERLAKQPQVKFLLNHQLTAINGQAMVDSITVKERQSGQEKQIAVTGVFIYAGFLPNSKFLQGLVEMDQLGYVKTDQDLQTKTPGIYAAGDVRSKKVRQITTACGEGTVAAISARDYIRQRCQ